MIDPPINPTQPNNVPEQQPSKPKPSLYRRVEIFWSLQSIWTPIVLVFAAIFFFVIKPGSIEQFFGHNPDLTKNVEVAGMFQDHASVYDLYSLRTGDGRTLRLSCAPRRQKQYCLKRSDIRSGLFRVKYAPVKAAWPTLEDGVIVSVTEGNRVLLSEGAQLRALDSNHPLTIAQRLLIGFASILYVIPFSVALFVLVGVKVSLERAFGMIAHGRRSDGS